MPSFHLLSFVPFLIPTGSAVTYSDRVARILQDNCQVCHHPGTAAPFSLLTYGDAVKWADNIREAVADERMPPWFADPRYGKFANDRRLKKTDRDALLAWIDSNRPEGDASKTLPAGQYPEGWTIGTPDLVLEMPEEEHVPATGTVPYKTFSQLVPWKKDALITAIEVIPGDRRVVHHIELYLDGFLPMAEIASFAPGSPPVVLPPDTVCYFPANHTLFWLMHYTPNGKATVDRSKVGFKFWKGDAHPKYVRTMLSIQKYDIDIPPNAANFAAENHWTADRDTDIIAIRPHMHLRGKDFRLQVNYPYTGRAECLLSVPRYDFNWQLDYVFATPLHLPAKTKLDFFSHYDNSANNPSNPDPSKRVKWGQQTDDEMQTVLLEIQQKYEDAIQARAPAAPWTPRPVHDVPPPPPQPAEQKALLAAVAEWTGWPLLSLAGLSLLAGLWLRRIARTRPSSI
jgi:hypothetical protein